MGYIRQCASHQCCQTITMRVSVLLVSCCIALVTATAEPNQKQPADKDFIQKQQKVLQLFVNVNQPNYNAEQTQYGQSYNPRDHVGDYTNTRAVKEFINQQKEGFLPNNEVFSPTNPQQKEQVVKLFDFLYFAKDFNTFCQAASYARQNTNGNMFDYALRAAVLHRPDTQGIQIPPLSDTYPFMFVDSRIIQQAQYYKQQGQNQGTFYSNYSSNQQNFQNEYEQGNQQNENPNFPFQYESPQQYQNYYNQYNCENQLSYYTDDVQLNEFNSYFFLLNPSFMSSQKYGKKNQNEANGEEFYYYLQQSLARYNLERLSNNLPSVRPIQFNQPIKPGYNPNMQQRNGEPVPMRPNNIEFQNANSYYLMKLRDVERRLQDAVDSEQVVAADGSKVHLTAENGIEILGKAAAGNAESVNKEYYSINNGNNGYFNYYQLFLKTVGNIMDPYNQNGAAPGALSYYGAAQRDPVYYQILARIVKLFQNFKNKIQPYTQEQMNFPEVKVQSMEVDELNTYYDSKDIDLYSALKYQNGEQAENFDYKARQYQLNYKPFNYQVNVQSQKDAQAIVRVFIGPKYNVNGQQYTLEQARNNFVEFDRFVVQLKSGQNQINRNSKQSNIFVEEQPNTRTLFRQLKQASQGAEQMYFYQNPNQYAGFPQNLVLPKGNKAGQEFTFFVIVNQYEPRANYQGQSFYPNVDNRPFGFPFDRKVQEENYENASNIYFKNVKIYHKNKNEVNNKQ